MRIVGGAWRGRALVAPPGRDTRPTADRVRQALFDMLLHAPWGGREVLEGASVLDAFAGTGALGLEGLSRGAARASFIERDAAALAALRANIAACRAGELTRVVAADALLPPRASFACSVVFLDPPYGGESPSPLTTDSPTTDPLPSFQRKRESTRRTVDVRFRGNDGKESASKLDGITPEGEQRRTVERALRALHEAGWIAPGGLIVAETARDAVCPAPLAPLAERVHGAAKVTVWRAA